MIYLNPKHWCPNDDVCASTVQCYQSQTPGSGFAMIENAAHVTMHDNPEKDIQVISGFLAEIEGK
jgi:pimeloyl-ACP methyl ester carboxylesterase